MPPESDMAAAQGGSNNSSDFVRKLYKMLEDPSYGSVVRWGNQGDSFVVLENEKFTKTILPKHFKHSNFASFVRQLNKYDFHKVRQNDESGQSPYGPQAWEFKHPEFRADRKDNLDNIRRKAPAPRKAQADPDSISAAQQVALLSDALTATQHQVQQLQEHFLELSHTNKVLVNEVVNLQNKIKSQSQIHQEVISHLSAAEDRRRNGRNSDPSGHTFSSGGFGLSDPVHEPTELRRARDLLNGIAGDNMGGRELERLSISFQGASPPESATSSTAIFSQPNSATIPMDLNDPRHLVYPVGQTNGIDPFSSDHVNIIPYSRPLSNPSMLGPAEAPPHMHVAQQQQQSRTRESAGTLWGPKRPRILLVEDDKTCARIGSKFLSQLGCEVEVANDGYDAVTKVNQDPNRYDLIFMDIIMPNLDGVSATVCIREAQPRVSIVAMTSNIRQEDIETYFNYGMNDVLAKPFTRDGMIRTLKKQLEHLLKNPPVPADSLNPGGAGQGMPGYQGGMAHHPMHNSGASLSTGGGVRFDTSPIQSPATTASWHSPSQMPHNSPTINQMEGGYVTSVNGAPSQMVMTPGGTQRPPSFNASGIAAMGTPPIPRMPEGMSNNDDRPEKRQRMYGPGQGPYGQ